MTISACLIVKNEATVLARCLDSIKDLVEEIVIIDTGSTDNTKDIAKKYTDLIYDFEWIDDFSAARNYAFSKCSMDFIYSADADEYLDEANRQEFLALKQCLIPEVEIIQMHYNTIANNTVLNTKMEYRPKLFKRLRTWTWIDPIHENVRLKPVVFDSDVIITHAPVSGHQKRDFSIFQKAIANGGKLSDNLLYMYATELLKTGEVNDFAVALPYFTTVYYEEFKTYNAAIASAVLCRYFRMLKDVAGIMKFALEAMNYSPCSEICYDVAKYYFDTEDWVTALKWSKIAYEETEPIIDVHTGGDDALKIIISCLKELELYNNVLEEYQEELKNWKEPEETFH